MNNEQQVDNATDITIYGATGFVAQYVGEYAIAAILSKDVKQQIKITFAGRNEKKLKDCLSKLRKVEEMMIANRNDNKDRTKIPMDIFIADANDNEKLRSMSKRTAVVINCAGPFERYGTNIVEACAITGTDYVDITGEVEWAARMRREFGPLASKSGARIVSLCGFDSIPSDLTVYKCVQMLKEYARNHESSVKLNVSHAKSWHAFAGLMNGGTLHTALDLPVNLYEWFFDSNTGKMRTVPYFVCDPFILIHSSTNALPSISKLQRWKNIAAKAEWMNNLPSIDNEFNRAVSIPFLMAPVNAKVVLASAVALKYTNIEDDKQNSSPFQYKERLFPLGFSTSKKLGILSAVGGISMLCITTWIAIILKLPYLGKYIANLILPPGSGSPDYISRNGYTEIYTVANGQLNTCQTDSDSNADKNMKASCRIRFQGDPGNLVTAQCVVESALCLLLNRSELPKRSEDGFGTPAQIFGDIFLKRLMENTVRPIVIETQIEEDGCDRSAKIYKESAKMD